MKRMRTLHLEEALLAGAFMASAILKLPVASAATVTVNRDSLWQTIERIGGDYSFSQAASKVGQPTLQNPRPTHARVEMDLSEWEPTNDDSNTLSAQSINTLSGSLGGGPPDITRPTPPQNFRIR
jgi:hypothetical protein